MASIQKRGKKWRAFVCVDGKRSSKTFDLKREAVAWANEQEEDGILAQHTFRELCAEYKPIAEKLRGSQAALSRLRQLETVPFIDLPLEYVTSKMISAYRDARLKEVAPVSVRSEMVMMGTMFKLAIRPLGWLRKNPCEGIEKPKPGPARRRGVTQAEFDAIVAKLEENKVGAQVAQMARLSLETGMRLGEIVSLKWANVREKSLTLDMTKNADRRDVPLSPAARKVIEERKGIDPVHVFTHPAGLSSRVFRYTRDKTPYKDVHFHDIRSEAVTRLSKKLDVLQLAKMIGHRDLKSLMFYYAESADEMADRL